MSQSFGMGRPMRCGKIADDGRDAPVDLGVLGFGDRLRGVGHASAILSEKK